MPSIEIRNDTSGFPPHTCIVVTDAHGVQSGWGFFPATQGEPNTFGQLKNEELSAPFTSTTGPLELTDAEYQRLDEYIQRTVANPPPYSIGFGSQCTIWAIRALTEARGGNQHPDLPNMWPDNFLRDLKETILWNPWTFEIKVNVWRTANDARNWTPPPADPLVLDLDGDGIHRAEQVMHNRTRNCVHAGSACSSACRMSRSVLGCTSFVSPALIRRSVLMLMLLALASLVRLA